MKILGVEVPKKKTWRNRSKFAKHVSFWIPHSLLKTITLTAIERNISRSQLVKEALEHHVERTTS